VVKAPRKAMTTADTSKSASKKVRATGTISKMDKKRTTDRKGAKGEQNTRSGKTGTK